MATTQLSLTLESAPLSPHVLGQVFTQLEALVTEVEFSVTRSDKPVLHWYTTDLQRGSYTLVVEAEPLPGVADSGTAVVAAVMQGIEQVEKFGERPDSFSDEALGHLKSLADILGPDAPFMTLNAPSVDMTVTITPQTSISIDQMVMPRRQSIGGVEGTLEAISVHGPVSFTVYDAVTGRAVRCYFGRERLEQAIAALGKRVAVRGLVRRDNRGRPVEMRDCQFRTLGTGQTRPSELAGVFGDIGIDVRDYIDWMRDDRD